MSLIDIQAVIDSIVSDDFPKYTVLLGIGPYNESGLLNETEFYDLHIEDKMNSINTASLIFVSKTEDELQDQGIRVYLDGKKKFSGIIKKCSKAYRSNEISCECIGIAFEIQRENITEQKSFQNVRSSTIIEENLIPGNWTVEIDTSVNDFLINYRLETGNFLQHIHEICVLNYWEWVVDETDSDSGISTRKLVISSHRGRESPSMTFTLESSAYDAIIDKDKDKLKNAILVSGSSSPASNTTTTAAGFFNMGSDSESIAMGYVIGLESYVVEPVAVGATQIVLENASGYEFCEMVQIDDEEITVTSVSGNTLNVAAVSETHEPGSPVLKRSLITAYLPPSVLNGSRLVWIGNELIQYRSADYWGLRDVTRGVEYAGNPTPVYAHGDGTKIFNGENSLNVPNNNSSIGSWGQVASRISNSGSTDRDGLDKYGTSVLLSSQRFEPFGSFQAVIDELSDLVVGDAFFLQEYGTGNQVLRRCTGLVFAGDIITIQFGFIDEYILNQFDSVVKIDNSTYIKQDLNNTESVEDISPDEKAVLLTNGTWLPLR